MMRYVFILLTVFFLGFPSSGPAKTILTGDSEGMVFQVDEIVSGQGVIWGLAFLSAERLLFTERQGNINVMDLDTGLIQRLQGSPDVWNKDQGGMLDAAVEKDHGPGDWVYFTYSKKIQGQGATTLARARLQEEKLTDWQDLLVTKSVTGTSRHFGSRIAFDGSGHLFFSVGDRGVRPNGQDRSTHAGAILRVNLDGSPPEDNPFVEENGLPEIWSYGHRNPQGLFWVSTEDRLWSNEHGPRGGDEINLIQPGENYGWPVVSHGKEYWAPLPVGEATSKPGMADPAKVFTPSIAPSSLLVYSGKAFPLWQGNFFSGALAMTHLNRVVLDSNDRPVKEERLLLDLDERIRDVIESPEGWLYVSTDSGRIFRIKPSAE
ncbi:MAG TPA: PQQ-dependent sugar dehydrogenase [Desulfotignum sp.]|nr:PQQ-dependent sugar dehydrogenase [Desulfotignum sp.]